MPREITFAQAINEALREEMRRDERVYLIGESVGANDYHMDPTVAGIAKEFGDARARETGIIEPYIGGSVVGAALAGMRPVADYMNADYATLAYDEIFAKGGLWRYEHGGNGDMGIPLVWRMTIGSYGRGGAEHSRTPTALFMHGIGFKLVVPSNAYDAKGLLKTAIRDDNPVVFMEPRALYRDRAEVPEDDYTVPFGVASVRRQGSDCTIVAVGFQVKLALQAAAKLAEQGVEVEVIDPRTLIPLDIDTIVGSVRKTGRLVVVDEDVVRCGVHAEIAFQVQEAAFSSLKAPIQRVGNPNLPIPVSPVLNREILPSADKIAAAVGLTLGREVAAGVR